MSQPVNETQLVKRITAAIKAEWPDAWVVKIAGGAYQNVGIPDLLLCREGRFIGLEVKHQKVGESKDHARSRVTAIQEATIAAIRRAGGTAGVVLTVEEALDLVRERGTLT